MSPSKTHLVEERPLPPMPSPSVVDTRIPQARRPSLSATYASPSPPVTEDDKPVKITIEANLKPSTHLSGVASLAPLSKLAATTPQPRDGTHPLKFPTTVRASSTPTSIKKTILKPSSQTLPISAGLRGSSTPTKTAQKVSANIAPTAVSTGTTSRAQLSSARLPTKNAGSVTAPTVSAIEKKASPAGARQNISASAIQSKSANGVRPMAASASVQRPAQINRDTSASQSVRSQSATIERRTTVQALPHSGINAPRPAVKASVPSLDASRISLSGPIAPPNQKVMHTKQVQRPGTLTTKGLVSNTSRPANSVPRQNIQVVRPAPKVEKHFATSNVSISKTIALPTTGPRNGAPTEPKPAIQTTAPRVAPAVAKEAQRLVTASKQRPTVPVARTLFQPPPKVGNPGSRQAPQPTKLMQSPGYKRQMGPSAPTNARPGAPGRTGVATAVPSVSRNVQAIKNPLRARRTVMKVVHPTPIVKTLTRPMARVIPTHALASVRSTPRTAPPGSHIGQVPSMVSGIKRPVPGKVPSNVINTPGRHASATRPLALSTLTAAQKKMVPSVPNMTPEIVAAAVAAAAAVEPTPPLVGPGSHIPSLRTVSPIAKPSGVGSGSVQNTPVRVSTPRATPAAVPRPRPVTPAPVKINVVPTPVPVPMFTPATIPEGMTFRDGEHVTIWNRLELRKIAGNAAPLGKNVERYLREHPDCEVYTNQDVAVRANRRKRQKFSVEEAAAGEHVPIWNKREQRKIAGNASPLAKNLEKYLSTRPDCEVYTNQDVVLKEQQQQERVNRAREESAAEAAALQEVAVKKEDEEAKNSSLYPDPFADAAPPLDEWRSLDADSFVQTLADNSSYRETANLLLDLYNGDDEDDISVAIMSGPGEAEDLDINAFLEDPESVVVDDVVLPGISDEFLLSPTKMMVTNSSVGIS